MPVFLSTNSQGLSSGRCHVGTGRWLHATEMETARRRDESTPDKNEETRPTIAVRQVDGLVVVDVRYGRRSDGTEIAGQEPV